MAVSVDESFQGHLLNIEQKVACKAALVKVQLNEDLPSVSFWGQIQGIEKDYLIAQALVTGSKDFQKKFYFSNDEGVTFSRLPPFDDWALQASSALSGPLTGQPSHKYPRPLPAGAEPSEEEPEAEPEDEDEEAKKQREAAEQADPTKRKLTELERLSWLVAEIDRDTSIVPIGAYCLTATQEIVRNPYFNGLSVSDAKSLSSYLLTRAPKNPQTLVRLHQAGIANVTQFLDTVAEEQPKGSWTLHLDDSGLNTTVRSLIWPGYEFKATVGSPFAYGGAYFGTGERNSDLVFML